MNLLWFYKFCIQQQQKTGISLRIRTLTLMDDDWRITVGTNILSDPQSISSGNSRDETFDNVPENALVQIDLYDGATTDYRKFIWEATIYWPDTTTTILTGGSTESGWSTIVPMYRPNGWFYIAKTQPTTDNIYVRPDNESIYLGPTGLYIYLQPMSGV